MAPSIEASAEPSSRESLRFVSAGSQGTGEAGVGKTTVMARVALAESDLQGARASIQNALTIIDRFKILLASWQTFATASQIYKYAKEVKTAEAYRDRAESCILKIADSFEPNEPLRATFLAATFVRKILCERAVNKAKRQHGSRRVATP